RHVHDLLAHVHQRHLLDERDDEVQPGGLRLLVLAQMLDDAPLVRPHDAHARDDDDHEQHDECREDDADGGAHEWVPSLLPIDSRWSATTSTRVPRTSTTLPVVPGGSTASSAACARHSPRSMRTMPVSPAGMCSRTIPWAPRR